MRAAMESRIIDMRTPKREGNRYPSSVVRLPLPEGGAGSGKRTTGNGQRPHPTPLADARGCVKRSARWERADHMRPANMASPTATVMVDLGERSYPIHVGGG